VFVYQVKFTVGFCNRLASVVCSYVSVVVVNDSPHMV